MYIFDSRLRHCKAEYNSLNLMDHRTEQFLQLLADRCYLFVTQLTELVGFL